MKQQAERKSGSIQSAGLSDSVLHLLESCGVSIWQRHLETNELVVTPGLWTDLGYPSDSAPKTLDEAMAIFDPKDADRVLSELDDYLAGKTSLYRTIAQVRAANGDWRYLQFSGAVIARNESGKPLVVGGSMSDITQEFEQETMRNAAKRKINQLALREFEVFEGIVRGFTSKEIALNLGLSHRTIEFYRQRLTQKLKMQSLPDLIRLASAAGIAPAADRF